MIFTTWSAAKLTYDYHSACTAGWRREALSRGQHREWDLTWPDSWPQIWSPGGEPRPCPLQQWQLFELRWSQTYLVELWSGLNSEECQVPSVVQAQVVLAKYCLCSYNYFISFLWIASFNLHCSFSQHLLASVPPIEPLDRMPLLSLVNSTSVGSLRLERVSQVSQSL